jgi:glycosyltransferase involved in cell wall biosynthesis
MAKDIPIPATAPLVSAVIPTLNRPALVLNAVKSALRQTYANMEVVIVIDGPDHETRTALARLNDNRIQVVALDESVGGAEARNYGIRASSGRWIALLDDDDEWMEDKIALQLERAELSDNPYHMVFTRMTARFENDEHIWPRRLPNSGEPLSEYLFTRKGLTFGDGFLQTSSFFASRQMFVEVPFRKGQKRFQDTDWLLRASAHPRATFEVLADPLVIYYMDGANTVSKTPDWEYLYLWARSNRSLFTDRAYSFFLATQCVPRAAQQKEPFSVFAKLLRESFMDGSPNFLSIAISCNLWFVPADLRRSIREARAKWTKGFDRARNFLALPVA